MFKSKFALIFAIVLLFGLAILYTYTRQREAAKDTDDWREGKVLNPLSTDVRVQETAREDAPKTGWWLNSGGTFSVINQVGETIQADLSPSDKWAVAYASSNPLDTDRGIHPQNIFRLIYRNQWQDYSQESCFLVNRYNLSQSENRNQSNGFFFLNRYQDGDNLYYTGLRVDGDLVIKKKQKGIYTTLGTKKILDGIYNRTSNPNLIPLERWLGLKTRVLNINNGVNIELLSDPNCRGEWSSQLRIDDANDPILAPGDLGIRSDFMDLKFKDYRLTELIPNK